MRVHQLKVFLLIIRQLVIFTVLFNTSYKNTRMFSLTCFCGRSCGLKDLFLSCAFYLDGGQGGRPLIRGPVYNLVKRPLDLFSFVC